MPSAKLCQLVILIVVAGCSTQPGKDRVAAGGPDVQCRSEQPTGTMLATQICTTKAQRELQQKTTEDLRNATAVSNCPRDGAACY